MDTPEKKERSTESSDSRFSRRGFLGGAATAAAAAAAAGTAGFPGVASAATTASQASSSASGRTKRFGDIRDLKHVVIFMQENRSFDHYFGTLQVPGVAGWSDKQMMQFNNGQSILFQPGINPLPDGDPYLLPYHLDSTKYNAQNDGDTAHMAYFEPNDNPWQHALAAAFTIGDAYHASLQNSTDPNRVMMWSGNIDPDGTQGGPASQNQYYNQFHYTWETYPETLQNAGISWQIYVNNTPDDNWLGDYTDNTIREFAAFNPANANATNTVPRQGLLARGNVLQTNIPVPAGVSNDPSDLEYVLQEFIADCADTLIPQVSWVVSPYLWSEHPSAAPNYGAIYVNRVIQAIYDNPELRDSTLLIINYDEPDHAAGYFDHIPRPIPEPGTPNEVTDPTICIPGMGLRVPFFLVSPWTRGGWVAKETFDHTSTIQFLEHWTTTLGKPAICPNISGWRRSIAGDLTSAIDFGSFDNSLPTLPSAAELAAVAIADESLPPAIDAIPAAGKQVIPVQTPAAGTKKFRLAPYQQHATVAVNRSTGSVTAVMTNGSDKAVSMRVFPASEVPVPFLVLGGADEVGTPNTVSKATGPKTFVTDTSTTSGQYDFQIYGPDHFVRRFAGTVVAAGQDSGQVPVVDAKLQTGRNAALKITLSNQGSEPVEFTLTRNDYAGTNQTVTVGRGNRSVAWPADRDGYYDVIVTANTADTFTYRFAGHIS